MHKKIYRFIVTSLAFCIAILFFFGLIKVGIVHAVAPNPYWWIDNTSAFSQYDDYQYKNGRTWQGIPVSGTGTVDSYILDTTASYSGVAAVGPRPLYDGVGDVGTYFTSDGNSTQENEWECTELVKRFLFLEYGARSIAAYGYQVVDNYASAYPTMFKSITNNGSAQVYPKPGDILSYNSISGDYGHTALVKSVTNQSSGSATVQLIEQNASSTGTTSQTFSNWQFQNGIDDSSVDSHTVKNWLTPTSSHLTWTNEGNLTSVQYSTSMHVQSVLLPDGKVLIAGGSDGSGNITKSTQIYTDGSGGTGSWASKANMNSDREYHTLHVVTISGGSSRVLASGGWSQVCSCARNSAELYNESNNTWTATPTMNQARWGFASSVLSNGKVLVTGGSTDAVGNNNLTSTEIYDPVANTWNTTASLSAARYYHQQVTFTDSNGSSKVMVIGGRAGSTALSSTEIYDPSGNTWTSGPSLSYARYIFTATLLYDGRILVVGGDSPNGNKSEVYSPSTNSWTTYTTPSAVNYAQSVLLGSGTNYKVLTAGGKSPNVATAMLFNPSNNSWSTTTSMNYATGNFFFTTLSNGNALAAGGYNGSLGFMNKSEVFTP